MSERDRADIEAEEIVERLKSRWLSQRCAADVVYPRLREEIAAALRRVREEEPDE